MKRRSLLSCILCIATGVTTWLSSSPANAQQDPIPTDPPLTTWVSVVAADPEAAEPNPLALDPSNVRLNTASFVVTRKGSIDFDLDVHYALDGSAENGVDYQKLSGVVTIPTGSSTARIVVSPLADHLKEGTESVAVILQVPACIEIFPQPKECYQLAEPFAAKAAILDAPDSAENQAPKVHITLPSDGQLFLAPASITIQAIAVDVDGYAARVDFYADQAKVGTSELVFIRAPDPGTPLNHEFVWNDVAVGTHELVAVAYDDQGAATKSVPVQVRVVKAGEPVVVTISAPDAEAAEPRTPLPTEKFAINRGQFEIKRTGETGSDLKVYFSLAGTAMNGADYEPIVNTAVIATGSSSVLIDVFPINDQVIEPTETVIATILRPRIRLPQDPVITPNGDVVVIDPPGVLWPPYQVGKDNTAVIKIADNGEGPVDETPVVNIVATDPEATEPPTDPLFSKIKVDEGRFTISRTGKTDQPLTVAFRVGGTATQSKDYVSLSNLATIPVDAESVELSVFPLFDTLKEGDESVVLRLVVWAGPVTSTGSTGEDPSVVLPPRPIRPSYKIGEHAEAKVVIHDTNVIVENRPPKAAITQPVPGSIFLVGKVIRIEVQTADADGYVPWVEFFDGKTKLGDSRIDFIQKPEPGILLTHSLEWTGASVGPHELIAVAHDDGGATTTTSPAVEIKVIDGSPRTVVTVRATDPEGAEPDPVAPGMGRPTILDPLVFTFTREGNLEVPILVHYHFEGTATPGRDFSIDSKVIEIAKGETTAVLMIDPIDDDLVEGTETVVVVIDPAICIALAVPPPTCYFVGEPGAAKGAIKDNDPNSSLRPTVTLTAADAIATEGKSEWTSPTATFVLRRTGPADEELVVYLKAGGTATSGKDYEAIPEKVVLAAGERAKRLMVQPIDDSEVEQIETVLLEVILPESSIRPIGWPAYHLGRPHKAVAVILDNDQKRPPCLQLPDGRFHVCLPGVDAQAYRIESSTNLSEWTDLGPVESSQGAVHFVDPEKGSGNVMFYRIVPVLSPFSE